MVRCIPLGLFPFLKWCSGSHLIGYFSPHLPTPRPQTRGSNGRMPLTFTQTRSFLYTSLFILHNSSSSLLYSRTTGFASGSVIHYTWPRMLLFSSRVTSILTSCWQVCPVHLRHLSGAKWWVTLYRFTDLISDTHTALPFLVRSELLLSPLLPLFTAYIISLLGFNVAKHVLGIYFHQ